MKPLFLRMCSKLKVFGLLESAARVNRLQLSMLRRFGERVMKLKYCVKNVRKKNLACSIKLHLAAFVRA